MRSAPGAPTLPRAQPAWRRLYDRRAGPARTPSRRRRHRATEPGARPEPSRRRRPARRAPSCSHALAEMSVREGRTDEALQRARRGRRARARRNPRSPTRGRGARRGVALEGGGAWLREAALASPLDDTVWSHLAVAYGSADEPAARPRCGPPRPRAGPARRRHAARAGPGPRAAWRRPRTRSPRPATPSPGGDRPTTPPPSRAPAPAAFHVRPGAPRSTCTP